MVYKCTFLDVFIYLLLFIHVFINVLKSMPLKAYSYKILAKVFIISLLCRMISCIVTRLVINELYIAKPLVWSLNVSMEKIRN